MADLNTHYVSGEPNTTGREPFEDSGRNTNVGSGGYTQQLSSGIGGAGTQGFDQGQGQGHGQGLTGADTGAGFGSTGENYKNVAPGAAHAHGLGGHGHGHSHEHTSGSGLTGTTGNTGNTGASSAVGTAVGTGASEAVGGEHHSHHGHHHGHQHTADVPGPGSTKPSGEGYGGIGASDVGSHVDRVGPQGQGQAAYERTGAQGPATTGAAGTDRFDTGSTGAAHGSAENQDTSQRAPGKSSGGIGGILGTSDKDFTGRERQGGTMGAYADSDGPVEGNTSGPKGHTALTGREGNLDENPVAQAKSRGDNSTSVATATGTHGHAESEHKGLMDKVKDAFKS